MQLRYRPEIDGLRAVAIVPVVLFHAGVKVLAGGYVGVDLFFVLSGFLIGSIIFREVDAGEFSLIRFYERRVRRIAPALLLVIACVLATALVLFFPDDFKRVARSAIATLLFISNLNFWSEADYFGTASQTKPLLHTWSLSVEEQFYILFPPLIVAIARLGRDLRKAALWAIFAVSLAFSWWQTAAHPSAAFFLPFSRTWELMAGALLAAGALPEVRNPRAREAIAVAGLLAIVAAILLFTERTPFPGLAALLPVLGSVALVHCSQGTRTGRLLSTRPMVGIGLISYSLYLWHWPLIVFVEYATEQSLSGWATVLVVSAAVLAAVLSWRFVERPFRNPQRVRRAPLFAMAGSAAAGLAAVSSAIILAKGVPGRYSEPTLALLEQQRDFSPLRGRCHLITGPTGPVCQLGADVAPEVLVWGDSHGVELSYALAEDARGRRAALLQATTSSCPPLPSAKRSPACDRRNDDIEALILRKPDIRTVVLVGYWSNNPEVQERDGTAAAIATTARQLAAAGKRVLIMEDAPAQSFDVPRRLARLSEQGRLDQQTGRTVTEDRATTAYLRPTLERLRREGIGIIDAKAALCRGDRCDIYRHGKSLYFDKHHLSMAGARVVARQIAPVVFARRSG
jgi:peptidoglycan/LPS O-acetylase OafA/YrhL